MKSSFEANPLPGEPVLSFVASADTATPRATVPPSAGEESPPPAPVPQIPHFSDEARSAIAALESAAVAVHEARAADAQDLSATALEIGLVLARHVLERELAIDPQALLPLVERAVGLVEQDRPIEVQLHPSDLEVLEADGSDSALCLSGDALLLRPNSALGRGEANVLGGASRIEVTLETVLATLREECIEGWGEPV